MKLTNDRTRLFAYSIVDAVPLQPSDFFVFCVAKGCQENLDKNRTLGGVFPDQWLVPGVEPGSKEAQRAQPYLVALRLLQAGLTVYYATPNFKR